MTAQSICVVDTVVSRLRSLHSGPPHVSRPSTFTRRPRATRGWTSRVHFIYCPTRRRAHLQLWRGVAAAVGVIADRVGEVVVGEKHPPEVPEGSGIRRSRWSQWRQGAVEIGPARHLVNQGQGQGYGANRHGYGCGCGYGYGQGWGLGRLRVQAREARVRARASGGGGWRSAPA